MRNTYSVDSEYFNISYCKNSKQLMIAGTKYYKILNKPIIREPVFNKSHKRNPDIIDSLLRDSDIHYIELDRFVIKYDILEVIIMM